MTNIFQMYWVWMGGVYLAEIRLGYRAVTKSIHYIYGLIIACMSVMLTVKGAIPYVFTEWLWSAFFIMLMITSVCNESKSLPVARYSTCCISFIAIVICYLLTYEHSIVYNARLHRAILLALVPFSMALTFIAPSLLNDMLRTMLMPFKNVGSYSYALYIFHWPLLILSAHMYKRFIANNILNLSITVVVFVITLIKISKLLELRLQPWFVYMLNHISGYNKIDGLGSIKALSK
jgi:peptidoglycan/LPS O-acetylase OafA/YrhL